MKRAITFSFYLLLLVAFSFSGFAQEISNVTSLGDNNPVYYGPANHGPSNGDVPCTEENPNDFTFENGFNCSSTSLFQTANDLTVAADEDFELSQITASIFANGGITLVDVIYYDDAAGLPGAVIGSEAGIVPTSQVVIGSNFGLDVNEIVLDVTPFTFAGQAGVPTTYWIELSVTDGGGTGSVFWVVTSSTAVGNPTALYNAGWLIQDPLMDGVYIWGGDCTPIGGGGMFPEVLYYTFDEAGMDSTENFAVPGRGDAWADLFGGMTMGSAGQFGSALIGTGASSSTDYVSNNWVMDIGTGDWTISCWLDIFDESTLHYIFGETDVSFRCFYGGVAPTGGVVMRGGGLTDVPVTGLIPGPAVVHFVYDSSVPEVRTYVNGVFQSAVGQTAPDLTSTSDIFKVGSRGSSTNLAAGELLDEFRFYDRALDDAEVAATWNITIIPVELTSFTASVNENDVNLNWVTASELNNSGFQVERKSTGEFEAIGFVPGFGTTSETRSYSFSDANLNAGTYTYRLKQIDYDGTFEYSDPVEVEIIVPDVYSLHQNYPNPFNPSTTITFTLAANANVTLRVFDVLGQEVMTLINQDLTAGVHTYDFDAASFNSGVYFYRIEANGNDGTNFTNVKKMILLK